jgi:hypothetical protein
MTVCPMKLKHILVTIHFGQDGSRGYGFIRCITPHKAYMRDALVRVKPVPVNHDPVR